MSTDDENSEQVPPSGALTTAQPRANQVARRDFAGSSLSTTTAATEALVAQERASVEARWIMAMRNPRDHETVRIDVLAECRRPEFADVATYRRPVGKEKDEATGQWVDVFADGLSIRFAEVALRCMGNMQCRARVTYDDPRTRMITVTACDYQTNATWDIDLTVAKTVERKSLKKGQKPLGERINSYGDRVYIVEATDQQVATTCAAEISKASRTAILRLVPGDIQDEAFALARKVAADRDAKDPKAAKRRMLDAFAEFGIKPPEIEQWLGHPIEGGTREEFVALSNIASGIREREVVWSDVLAERLAEQAQRKPAAATGQPQQATATTAQLAAQPAQATQPAQTAQATPAAATSGGAKSSGKGTAALKGALVGNKAKPTDPREAEPGWMSGQKAELPPDEPPPKPGYEDRGCAKCGAVIEVPISDPPGGMCYACSAAARE